MDEFTLLVTLKRNLLHTTKKYMILLSHVLEVDGICLHRLELMDLFECLT